MKIKIYQVDAFSDRLFSGNPAAVCMLEEWLSEELMQAIAAENNLAETAFVVPGEKQFEIRWFTPTLEVDLCGHATLASAFVLFDLLEYPEETIRFHSHVSGWLMATKKEEMILLDFPVDTLDLVTSMEDEIKNCIGVNPLAVYKGKTDYIAVLENEDVVMYLQPDLQEIAKLPARGLIVTAKGREVDFVSRFFAPQSGIDEDPVTGSAHTSLLPLWSEKTGKNRLSALQLSKRGGELWCELKEDRCLIGGQARLYLSGELSYQE
jgi:PhzF family phenazine biosynthesis protein